MRKVEMRLAGVAEGNFESTIKKLSRRGNLMTQLAAFLLSQKCHCVTAYKLTFHLIFKPLNFCLVEWLRVFLYSEVVGI